MKVLVCGGRDYHDKVAAFDALNALPFKPTLVIEGGANGADRLGRIWAQSSAIHVATICALWDTFGRSAGYKRNIAMSELAEYCVAFPGGNGTANMIDICKRKNIVVWEPYQ